MRPLAALSCLLLSCALLGQSAERDAVTAFRRQFGVRGDALPQGEDGVAAVGLLGAHDSATVAGVLLRAFAAIDQRTLDLEHRKLEVNRELHESLLGRGEEKVRGGVRMGRQLRAKLRVESWALRQELDGLRPVRAALQDRIAALRSDRALDRLRDSLLSSRASLGARLAAARACAATEPGRERLSIALRKCKGADQLVAILAGMSRDASGTHGLEDRQALLALLARDSAAVREGAARALTARRVPEAVGPMIELLAQSRGRLRKEVAALLGQLTGQRHGENIGAWRAWYADVRDDLLAGRLALGSRRPHPGKAGGKPRGKPRQEAAGGTTYMGIPQDGESIVYVLDASLSMNVEVDFEIPGMTIPGGGAPSRLDACKAELNRALGTLPPTTRFNIVFLHETAGRLSDTGLLATPENVAAARAWVRSLKPEFATNIHDALLEAYALLADELRDRAVGEGIDTVFLLTDGRPVVLDPRGQRRGVADSFPRIVAAIEDWDPLGRVTVHCIGIGKGLNKRMMRRLAQARGGQARFY